MPVVRSERAETGAVAPTVWLVLAWVSVGALGAGCICIRPQTSPPPFPEQANLAVRRSSEPSPAPFGACTGFTNSFGHDGFCSGGWDASFFEDGSGAGGANQSPQLQTYGYAFSFVGDRAQLCRYFGDELGDEHGCTRGDVRCARSGELVIHDDGGGHIVGEFEGGARIEAAFRFRFPVDAGVRADSWP
ncbi:MAG: hypothetical protein U0353_33130 [Sandaracinus sp.]